MKFSFGINDVTLNFDQPISVWLKDANTPALLAAQILEDIDQYGGDLDSTRLHLPPVAVAAWSEAVALCSGLPPNTPFPIDLRSTQGLGKAETKITIRWLRPGTAIPVSSKPNIEGLFLCIANKKFRLQEPYFSALQLVESFNALPESETLSQLRIWSEIRQVLGGNAVDNLSDYNLRSIRIINASKFTLNYTTDSNGDVQLQPVLLSDSAGQELDPNDTLPRALLETDEKIFVNRLDNLPTESSTFPLSNGSYVILDNRLQKALTAIKTLRQAKPETRKRAAFNPEAYLAEVLDDEILLGQPLFIETERYSKRVSDLGEWEPPILPWIKITSQSWDQTSDRGGFRINGQDLSIGSSEEIEKAIELTEQAINDGHSSVNIPDPDKPEITHELPASVPTITALKKLRDAVLARENSSSNNLDNSQDKPVTQVLIIETNFENTAFINTHVEPRAGEAILPYTLNSEPKPHQIEGINWLQQHWLCGSKGALLADDMGLGKTFQSLAFMAWIKELIQDNLYPKKPMLIVAPIGLLKNWEAEHEMHLKKPGLGSLVRAYGSYLKELKNGTHENGSVRLDTLRLSRADWILANYEAINNYQLSFGLIDFSLIIYDEAQKIKSPNVRVTQAAKALNTEFTLAMTGTPVENRLSDLWCIADTVQPGALADLKVFSQTYEANDSAENLLQLRQKIWHETTTSTVGFPKMMLRRMKTEKLKGLPLKKEAFIQIPMPSRQREAYERAIKIKNTKGSSATLEMIQALRAISLHPALYEGGFSHEGIEPADSARFMGMMSILEKIHQLNEKALIFVESLELQESQHLPLYLQRKFGMARPPLIINGEVDTASRQKRVNEFQNYPGFDLMLLSPKAGGVGITLTQANHVIHLSRWWNPAVEDQCSDRAYRIGQTKDVTVYYPMAVHPDAPESSFDVKLNELMIRKRDLSQRLLAPSNINKEDISQLIDEISVF